MTTTASVKNHKVLDVSRRLVFAHRGGARLRPENTTEAFDHGLALGADGLELDVHLSRDDEVVVIHDATLDRTTNGKGRVEDHTLPEIAEFDAGWQFGETQGHPFRGRGLRVPLLRDVLERYPSAPIIVELKGRDPRLARAAVGVVERAGALDRVCFGGFEIDMLTAARERGHGVVSGAATPEVRAALNRSWFGLGPKRPAYQVFQVPERSGGRRVVTARFVRVMRRVGLPVFVWTVDAPDDMHRLMAWGVNGIISDRPDVAVDVVGRWRKR